VEIKGFPANKTLPAQCYASTGETVSNNSYDIRSDGNGNGRENFTCVLQSNFKMPAHATVNGVRSNNASW
jgi:hypothetical protein